MADMNLRDFPDDLHHRAKVQAAVERITKHQVADAANLLKLREGDAASGSPINI
jgi:plasmid stability protein